MKKLLPSWIPAIVVAATLGMAGAMKLMMNPDAAKMFADLGGPPWLILAGMVEAIAILLLVPKTRLHGAAVAADNMLGAIGAHTLR